MQGGEEACGESHRAVQEVALHPNRCGVEMGGWEGAGRGAPAARRAAAAAAAAERLYLGAYDPDVVGPKGDSSVPELQAACSVMSCTTNRQLKLQVCVSHVE